VLPPEVAADESRVERFRVEGRATGALNHPNILAVHDAGNDSGVSFVVSELLEGKTLREVLSSGKLGERKSVALAVQIARGLSAAHSRGIVHRDLKPENIFITNDGVVKILDFGLAKLMPQGESPELTRTFATGPGLVMGTAGYMSPEQLRGEPVDAHSDLFSFGAVLYEMLSGRKAFHANTAADSVTAVLKDEPPELDGINIALSGLFCGASRKTLGIALIPLATWRSHSRRFPALSAATNIYRPNPRERPSTCGRSPCLRLPLLSSPLVG
jgi:serine/threonine protein kinase